MPPKDSTKPKLVIIEGKDKGKNKGKLQKGKLFEVEGEEIVPSPVEGESSVWIDTEAVSSDEAVVDTAAAMQAFPLADAKAPFSGGTDEPHKLLLEAVNGKSWLYHAALLH